QCRSLKDFQHLTGWINWALNAYPLLRPGLSNVYKKMQQGSSPYQKLSINKAISNNLLWFSSHVDHSDGV
ncbi:hypothetical protein BYT27DRAFT_7009647, partial [Phlegmacium glaucopus]